MRKAAILISLLASGYGLWSWVSVSKAKPLNSYGPSSGLLENSQKHFATHANESASATGSLEKRFNESSSYKEGNIAATTGLTTLFIDKLIPQNQVRGRFQDKQFDVDVEEKAKLAINQLHESYFSAENKPAILRIFDETTRWLKGQ